MSSRAVLVLSSNVVGVGEERLWLRDCRGADFQVFSVLVVRDALWGIKPPKAGLSVVGRQFWLALGEGLSLVNGQCPSLLGCGSDLDCLRCGCASDTVLGGCDFDEPGAGVFEADCALRGPLLSFLVGGDFAGAAGGSGGASFEASGRVAGGGDCVSRVGGGGKAAGDWLVDSASARCPADCCGGRG